MSNATYDPLNLRIQALETLHAISSLEKYLEVVEAQIEEVEHCERAVLGAYEPKSELEQKMLWSAENSLELLFENDLVPAMRYSFIVLIHTVFEVRLRAFCSDMRSDRKIPISLTEISGSPIDRARIYLTKLAGLDISGIPEWKHLRTFQKIRNCIAHRYGEVAESSDENELRRIVKDIGATVDDNGRLALTKALCEQYLAHVKNFFEALFHSAGG
jgi:hypothetical protein